ncbi:arsenate reductase (glutaredoxin) [Alloalcanivorax sp. C16-1]|uniref:arsenate reductase (glutaredoxin) n=1 Tax=Alloalcanivorax sp. C16-1 TaxID=3390051 RepID=UPI003970F52F
MAQYTIYHNPRCSKSRQTLALLEGAGIEPRVIKYLDTPPDADTLRDLVHKLGLSSAHQLVRVKEADYQEAGLSPDADDETVIQALARYPKLLERPVVVKGQRAVLGRPPENVQALIGENRG